MIRPGHYIEANSGDEIEVTAQFKICDGIRHRWVYRNGAPMWLDELIVKTKIKSGRWKSKKSSAAGEDGEAQETGS